MKLLTKELLREIPPVHSQDEVDDPPVVGKFFMPASRWTWYVIKARLGILTGAAGAKAATTSR